MAKYEVTLTTEKTTIVKADDYEQALDKAEKKVNRINYKWCAITAYEIKEG